MKSTFLVLSLFFSLLSQAQFGPQQIISNMDDGAFRAIPYDVDQDGFVDVISGSNTTSGGKIVWYCNQDGLGNFENERIIANIAALQSLEIFDLDGDEDMDILYKTNTDKIAWLENQDGIGDFGIEQIIVQTDYPYRTTAEDIDGDGDLDILATHFIDSFVERLVWYENTDGLGSFGPEIVIAIENFFNADLLTSDLDNDGDMDIVTSTGSFGPSVLVWYENEGSGIFASEKTIHDFGFVSDWTQVINIVASDLNGDNKIDLLIDTVYDGVTDENILWLESIDGLGEFESPEFIDSKHTTLGSLKSFDIDNDGDLDILLSFYFAGSSIAYYLNDGLGNFGDQLIVTTVIDKGRDASGSDINSDGIMDVVSASAGDNKIAWYENTGILGISDNKARKFSISPNPTKNKITINGKEQFQKATLFNRLGQSIRSFNTHDFLSLKRLASGIYFLRITSDSDISEVHKIIKE